jgi:hypothetical protein
VSRAFCRRLLDTFDQDLIKLSGKLGDPPIIIGEPNMPYQHDLFVKTGGEETSED